MSSAQSMPLALDGDVRLDVPIDRETVWLSLSQMAELYGQPAAPGGGTSQ